jgi:alcohol dehydrogenase (cytochrome c)
MLWGNRNGYFYVLDRETGRFLLGRPFVNVTWSSGLDGTGRPIMTTQPPAAPIYPGNQGATNWYSPSYSPRTGLFYLSAWENYGTTYQRGQAEYQPGRYFTGGGFLVHGPVPNSPGMPTLRRGPINNWTEAVGTGAVIAIDPATGQHKWKFTMTDVTDSGILTTASDLLFTGGREGYFQALDARTGQLLWKASLGGQIVAGPITYAVDGKQYVATIAGNNLAAFALRD